MRKSLYEFSEPLNRLHQIAESNLPILDRLPHAVLNDPALKVYRLSGWPRRLDPGSAPITYRQDYQALATCVDAEAYFSIPHLRPAPNPSPVIRSQADDAV